MSDYKEFKHRLDEAMRYNQGGYEFITRFFQEPRHIEDIKGNMEDVEERNSWRKYGKERMKTMSVALIMCLHIGIDPPDAPPKPDPCAKLLAWVDPFQCGPYKAAHSIATALQRSYERWQPRARYKIACDPALEDVRKICTTLRRVTGGDRVLFHYNGHGVPRPTRNGEIWVFNKSFTQYIPLSLYDLQSWIEYPAVYVWECSSAETIIQSFLRFAGDHEKAWQKDFDTFQERSDRPLSAISSGMDQDEQAEAMGFMTRLPKYRECIHLAACRSGESLPMDPNMPADLFTSCLTTPVQTSVLWYLIKSKRKDEFPPNILEEIPGSLTERKTVLGELNWIFTAITDTIAFTSLPRDVFQQLFRQDLLLASLFRSFLLSQRVMADYDCSPVSRPALADTSRHELWQSWDTTLDMVLDYVKELIFIKNNSVVASGREILLRSRIFPFINLVDFDHYIDVNDNNSNWFFVEQLQAFELWLDYGIDRGKPPLQLPVVLQVLLSQVHRVRALRLLARFLDFGQWAVGYSLSVGIFPYVLRLLQSNTREMRPWLAFIWAKILAVDPTCQAELFKENGDESTIGQPVLPKNQHVTLQQSYHGSSQHSSQPDQHSGGHHHHRQRQPAESQQPPGHPSTPQPGDKNKPKTPLRYLYFVAILNDPETSPRQKIVPAFVLATLFHNNYKVAQENLTEKGFVNLCTELLCDNDARECRLLKLWILIGLGRLWSDYNDARWQAVRLVAYDKVILELDDESPEVRAAAAFAIGSLLKNSSFTNEHATVIDQQLADQLCKKCTFDGAVLVREELIVALQWFVFDFEQRFVKVLLELSRKLHFEVPKKTEDIENEAIDIASHMPSTRSHADRLDSTDAGSSSMYKKKLHSSVFVSAMEETVSQGARRKKEIPAIGVSFAADYEFEDEDYRRRALLQIKHLEGSYGEPVARAWLALLRLSLDPMQHVARMAQRIVKRVEMQSHKMKETISEKLATLSQNQMARQLSHIEMRSPQPDGPPSTADFFRQTSALSKTSDNGHVRFVVGSPATAAVRISPADRAAVFGELFSNDSSPVASEAGDQRLRVDSAGENFLATSGDKRSSLSSSSHPPMKFAVGSPKDYEDEMKSASVASEEFLEDILSNTARTFTPKRVTTGRGEFTKEGESVALRKVINDPLVSTQFIPWCSRVFVEPIMQVLQSDATDDRTSDEVLTRTSPSDWAMHQLEGHRQTAETDLKALRNPTKVGPSEKPTRIFERLLSNDGQSSSNPSQVMTPVYLKTKQFKNPVTAVATSKIRKCVYATDGEKISIIVHEKDVSHCRTFDCNGGNPFTNDHVSQLITINEEAREMILCCSPIGIIRIWDPCYDSFSAGYERVPVLLTSAFPLMEYTKYSNTEAACLFDWNQSSGRVLCTGPKSVRIWDAHYEKTIQDIHYPQRSAGIGPPTALSGDLDSDSDLVAVGFSDGSVDVYDLRMPKHRALRLALETTLSSVMHLSLRRQENSNGTVFASNRNGLVVTWEPRMYKEPVQKLQIPWPKESHKAMSVHSDATHFVTTSADLIRFYDVNGPLLARLRGKIDKVATEKQNGTPFYPEVTAITMQQIRYQVVAGFSDKTIGIFAPGVPP